jgi:hypothetical protein
LPIGKGVGNEDIESDYVIQKALEALQEQSAQMVMPKCVECRIIAVHQQVIETLREVANAEIAMKLNMVLTKTAKCLNNMNLSY